jgi:predicted signal transduction protein with EAL and GGDEF domain
MNKPIICDNHELVMSASIGITLFPNDGADPETLIKNADMAMYRAKEQGKRTYQLYNPAMQTKVSMRLTMENNLRKAFERNEFVVHYQPKM